MDELIVRQLSGETTIVEAFRLEDWRRASPANEARFREFQMLWAGLGCLATRRQRTRPDVDAMIQAAEQRRARSRARGWGS